MQKLKVYLVSAVLLLGSVVPATAQNERQRNYYPGRDQRENFQDRGHDNRYNNQNRRNYYDGMNDRVRQGDYGRYAREDEQRHHHDDKGGIGPGKGALIGAAGGAALGAIFGGGLKGTLIGGAAGAGIGAIGGKLAQGDDDHRDRDHRR